MFPRNLLVPVFAFAFLLPVVAGDAAPYAPRAVAAIGVNGAAAVVAWAPGEVPADAYLVYGVNPGEAPTLLNEAGSTATFAPVPSGFAGYGVAGVRDGQASPLILAVGTTSPPESVCVWVAVQPDPYVAVCKLPRPSFNVEQFPLS